MYHVEHKVPDLGSGEEADMQPKLVLEMSLL